MPARNGLCQIQGDVSTMMLTEAYFFAVRAVAGWERPLPGTGGDRGTRFCGALAMGPQGYGVMGP